MNFRDAILETLVHGGDAKAREIHGRLRKAGPVKNRKFWQRFEERVRRRYERDTGKKLPEAVDWGAIISWYSHRYFWDHFWASSWPNGVKP